MKKSLEYLAEHFKDKAIIGRLHFTAERSFNFFEEKKQLPVIIVNKKGQYVFKKSPKAAVHLCDV